MNDSKPGRNGASAGPRPGATLLTIVACGVLLTLGALFFVWQRFQFVRVGFEVGALRQQQVELLERIEPLAVEAEYLSRPERIDALARGRLGMAPPAPSQVIVVDPDSGGAQ